MYGKELSARSISILHSFFFSPLTHLAPLSVFFSVSHLPLCAFPMVLAPGNLYFLASSSLLEPCNLMLLGAFIVVDRREGLTWSSSMLFSSTAFKLLFPVCPEPVWQFLCTLVEIWQWSQEFMFPFLGGKWQKVQAEKMLRHFWVLWGQRLDSADLVTLTLLPKGPSIMPKQPQERRQLYFQFLLRVPPDHAFAIQGREGTNDLKNWEGAEGVFQSQSTELCNPYSS